MRSFAGNNPAIFIIMLFIAAIASALAFAVLFQTVFVWKTGDVPGKIITVIQLLFIFRECFRQKGQHRR